MAFRRLSKSSLYNKHVYLRVDFNIPYKDYTKIDKVLPTILYALKYSASLSIGSHMGRAPVGSKDSKYSFTSLIPYLECKVNRRVDLRDPVESYIPSASTPLILFENLRLFKELSTLYFKETFDTIVFDAFSVVHRPCPELMGTSPLVGSYFIEEYTLAQEILNRVDCVILGGCKGDKLEVLENLTCTVILCGKIVQQYKGGYKNIILPEDCITDSHNNVVDIGSRSIEKYKKILKSKDFIFWNGPPGKFEDKHSSKGTQELLRVLSECENVAVGGGDTLSCINKYGYKFKWCSTSGGALLHFLSGKRLQALEDLIK